MNRLSSLHIVLAHFSLLRKISTAKNVIHLLICLFTVVLMLVMDVFPNKLILMTHVKPIVICRCELKTSDYENLEKKMQLCFFSVWHTLQCLVVKRILFS